MYIKTDRLSLRSYDKEDAEDMIALLTNESVKKTYMIPDLPTKEEQDAMFQKIMAYSHSDSHLDIGIYRNGKLIGFLNDVEMHKPIIEVGYVIHPDYQGMGYATEAFSALIRTLFECGYEVIIAGAFEDNIASISVMKKCGLHLTEETEDITYHNKLQHCVYYSIENKCGEKG